MDCQQERYWRLFERFPALRNNNVTGAYLFTVPLRCDAMRRALSTVMSRHPVTNGKFLEEDGRPRIRIEALRDAPLQVCASTGDWRSELEVLAASEHADPIVLSEPPLLKCSVLDCGDRFCLVLTVSHVVADAWSLSLLVQELAFAYSAFLSGSRATFVRAAPSFAAAVADERAFLRSHIAAARVAFWKRTLQACTFPSVPPDLNVVFRSDKCRASIPARSMDMLSKACVARNVPPSTLLQSVYASALHRVVSSGSLVLKNVTLNRSAPKRTSLVADAIDNEVTVVTPPNGGTLTQALDRFRVAHALARSHALPYWFLVQKVSPDHCWHPYGVAKYKFNHVPGVASGTVFESPAVTVRQLPITAASSSRWLDSDISLTLTNMTDSSCVATLKTNASAIPRVDAHAILHGFLRHFCELTGARADDLVLTY
jgi:hypothetical protein